MPLIPDLATVGLTRFLFSFIFFHFFFFFLNFYTLSKHFSQISPLILYMLKMFDLFFLFGEGY